MDLYVFAVVALFFMAVVDLMVGVSNDAVNFLNSPLGSRVAPPAIIKIIASLGILAGVTFSSGMMEVARKGIFHPRYFTMPDLMTIFLAVMITDVVLLDLFNTFGLPTSTTVSIVFALLGAAIAVSLIKIFHGDQTILDLSTYINTGKVLAIIAGILLSVAIAFISGAIVQFFTRLVFTFNYEQRLRRYGALWGGLALSCIAYFTLLKGAKGASFISPETLAWMKTHTWTILIYGFGFFAILFQLLILLTRINILKLIVLAGTFALAMAFAANDLVNFIGVPLASFQAFTLAGGSQAPLIMTMEALEKPVHTNLMFLIAAGAIMVVTLWFSRKLRTVTKTEVSLGRQDEGIERFDTTQPSRIILRMVLAPFDALRRIWPHKSRRWIMHRFETTGQGAAPGYDGKPAEFDLLRASTNLVVSSALIAWATSMKLPLSTTYVTFMVAMGTSLSDHAWGLESAVYRITGVLTVISGWFLTAFMAFTIALVFAFAIGYLDGLAVFGLLLLAGYMILRNLKIHRRREKTANELELLDLKRVTDAEFATRTCFEHMGRFLEVVRLDIDSCFEGILTQNRRQLKILRGQTKKMQQWSNTIAANIFKTLRLLDKKEIRRAGKYAYVFSALQEITESLRDMIMRCHVHTSNQHSGLLPSQRKELQQVRKHIEALLADTAAILLTHSQFEYRQVAAHYVNLKQLLEECDQRQVARIHNGESKTRLSILFYGINNTCLKISEQTMQLLSIFSETLYLERKEKSR
jgi:phosphate/sulfate permease